MMDRITEAMLTQCGRSVIIFLLVLLRLLKSVLLMIYFALAVFVLPAGIGAIILSSMLLKASDPGEFLSTLFLAWVAGMIVMLSVFTTLDKARKEWNAIDQALPQRKVKLPEY